MSPVAGIDTAGKCDSALPDLRITRIEESDGAEEASAEKIAGNRAGF